MDVSRVRRVWPATLLVVAAAAVVGCGSSSSSSSGDSGGKGEASTGAVAPAPSSEKQLTVGLALPGPINDRGYNQGLYTGLQKLKESGAKTAFVESLQDPAKALDAMKNLAIANPLVIVAGGQFSDVVKTAAASAPKTQFVLIDGAPQSPPPNVHAYRINYAENGYIAAAVAAKASKSHTIAFVGGLDIPPVQNSQAGFQKGVAASGAKLVQTSTGSFNDPSAAKEAASAQVAKGADVIFPFVDAAYTGVLDAVKGKSNVTVIVSNRSASVCSESPAMLGATHVDYPSLIAEIAKAYQADAFPTEPKTLGVADGIVQMELCPGKSSAALQKVIDDTTASIKSGSVSVPLK